MFVQKRIYRSAFDMTEDRNRAEVFPNRAAARRRAAQLSDLYGLRIVPANEGQPAKDSHEQA
jgi:hypothetical protein